MLERIGQMCFKNSGITQITVPGTVIEIGEGAFDDCNALKLVQVEDGCQVDLWKLVGDGVRVAKVPCGNTMLGD